MNIIYPVMNISREWMKWKREEKKKRWNINGLIFRIKFCDDVCTWIETVDDLYSIVKIICGNLYISLLIPETNTLNTIFQQIHFTIIVSDQENYTSCDNSRKWWERRKGEMLTNNFSCRIERKYFRSIHRRKDQVYNWSFKISSHIGLFSWNDVFGMILTREVGGMVASNWALLTRICESTGSILPRIGRTCEATKTDRVWN